MPEAVAIAAGNPEVLIVTDLQQEQYVRHGAISPLITPLARVSFIFPENK